MVNDALPINTYRLSRTSGVGEGAASSIGTASDTCSAERILAGWSMIAWVICPATLSLASWLIAL